MDPHKKNATGQKTRENSLNPPLPSLPSESTDTLAFALAESTLSETIPDLDSFREQWKQEIKQKTIPPKHQDPQDSDDSIEKATKFFLEGVEHEKNGDMSEAVRRYTKALKLVPDIEKRIYHHVPNPTFQRSTSRSRFSDYEANRLLSVFQHRISDRGTYFEKDNKNLPCSLLDLPQEILRIILKCVVGKHLDIRSLITVSEVSSFFYVLSRDNEIWRSISIETMGEDLAHQIKNETPDLLWKDRYIQNAHLHFFGVYVAKSTYIRHGETSFQDDKFRPWYSVTYFRLIRFFANGTILMTTTSDLPQNAAQTIRSISIAGNDTNVLKGKWWRSGNKICAKLHRNDIIPPEPRKYRKSRHQAALDYGVTRSDFQIQLTFVKRKGNKWGLAWEKNICTTTYFDGAQSTVNLEPEKDTQAFPPLRFFHVQSYYVDAQLQ